MSANDRAFAFLRLPPAPQQQLDLLLATDQRRQVGRMMRLEPALDAARAEHLGDLHRRRQSFERDATEIVIVEKAADETSRAVAR